MQLTDEEIANLSDAEFKTLVIRILTEMVEYGCKIKEKVKAMKSEVKENIQGTNSDGKKTRIKSTLWSRRKKETFNQNGMKKQEFKKMRSGLGTSRTSLNIPTTPNHRGARRREEEQEIENLFENIMKENFPNLTKEIDFQEVQEAQ